MRFQRALPVIGCGSLSILALVIGGCSSKSSNKTDSGVDSHTMDAPMDHTTATDVPKYTGVDKGKDAIVDTFKPPTDVRDTNGSNLHRHRADGATDFGLFEHQRRDLRHVRPGSGGWRHLHEVRRPERFRLQRRQLAHLRGGVQPPRSVRHLLELHRRLQRWLHAGCVAVEGHLVHHQGQRRPRQRDRLHHGSRRRRYAVGERHRRHLRAGGGRGDGRGRVPRPATSVTRFPPDHRRAGRCRCSGPI